MSVVRSGLDVLVARDFAPLKGLRAGLVAHPASVDSQCRHAMDLLGAARDVNLVTVFGPEHGLLGQAQDLIHVHEDESRGHSQESLKLRSLYGTDAASLRPRADDLRGLDVLVIDLQDVGSRYYTFQATMLYCLEAALPQGLPVIILDRPNPIGGLAVEGPALRAGFESFVGCADLATRHGLTLGELARLYVRERGIFGADLTVIPCEGWDRGKYADETGSLPWVLPSPNMPTVETAVVYPGGCLIEGTNMSEGRGTTRPFEIWGAPWLPARSLAERLTEAKLPGVIFRPLTYRPTFQKHAGVDCGGVQIHVTDRRAFLPVRTGYAILEAARRLGGSEFQWRTEIYEYVTSPIAIDLLFGSSRERHAIEQGVSWRDAASAWEPEERAFAERRKAALLYP
ncbi:MAG: DUF1343 domain-containing protein [Verrucomicrobiota bacterium]